jgi:uncharacterized membrane protein (DUF373 family)
MLSNLEERLRNSSDQNLHLVEVAFYIILGMLLILTTGAVLVEAARQLWVQVNSGGMGVAGMHVLDELLLALMLVEILHTVRISIRSQVLETEPFLIVGLIASIRRLLVITMQTANLESRVTSPEQYEALFRHSMLELGILGVLILVLVGSIFLLRRRPVAAELIDGT